MVLKIIWMALNRKWPLQSCVLWIFGYLKHIRKYTYQYNLEIFLEFRNKLIFKRRFWFCQYMAGSHNKVSQTSLVFLSESVSNLSWLTSSIKLYFLRSGFNVNIWNFPCYNFVTPHAKSFYLFYLL